MKIFGGRRSGNRGGYVKTVLTLAAVGASHPFSGISFLFSNPSFRGFHNFSVGFHNFSVGCVHFFGLGFTFLFSDIWVYFLFGGW